jgi:hypothetical protein
MIKKGVLMVLLDSGVNQMAYPASVNCILLVSSVWPKKAGNIPHQEAN